MTTNPHHTRNPLTRYTPGIIYLQPGAGVRRSIQLHRARTGWDGPVTIITP
jgi:hypothetical protein